MRDDQGRFVAGNCANPLGRPRGSKHKLSEEFISALLNDFEEHGEQAIVKMREEDNTQYVKMIALLIPKDHNVKVNEFDDLSLDELIERAKKLAEELGLAGSVKTH